MRDFPGVIFSNSHVAPHVRQKPFVAEGGGEGDQLKIAEGQNHRFLLVSLDLFL